MSGGGEGQWKMSVLHSGATVFFSLLLPVNYVCFMEALIAKCFLAVYRVFLPQEYKLPPRIRNFSYSLLSC